jgi:hypothetical protein
MKKLIIATLPPVEVTTVAGLSPGQGGIMLIDSATPNVLVTSLAGVGKDEKFQVVYKTQGGKLEVSPEITVNEIKEAASIGYNVGIKQKWTVTPILPAVQAKNMEWIVKLIDTTGGNLSVDQKTFNVIHFGTDYTAQTLVDAFVTAINAGDFKAVASRTGSAGTSKLVIEAPTPETHFSVAVDGELEKTLVVLTTKNVPASGTFKKMQALEAECESYDKGITNKVMYPVIRPVTEVLPGNYNRHIFKLNLKYNNKDGMAQVRAHSYTLFIASTTALNPLGKVIFDAI